MDAISFVLGIQSSQLRSSSLKELIFHSNASDPANSASVSASYQKSDGRNIVLTRRQAST